MNNFVCVSINYKLCDEDFRGKFAFEARTKEKLVSETDGAVLLCTCNRTELYYFGDESEGIRLFSLYGGIPEDALKHKIMLYLADKAISHLFKVACGIDSMVVGEDEILGQLKSAYAFSLERQKLSSAINLIFHSAITAAKKIKTQTELSKTAVSTATLAAKLAARTAERVMVIGATGKIGSVVLKDLLSYKNVSVTATARSHNSDIKISADNPGLEIIPYERRYDYIGKCGCVISATSGPHFTLTADKLGEIGGKRLYIDLAVPHDIDPQAAELDGAELRGIDYFTELARENNTRKRLSVEQAESIITREIDELKKRLLFQEALPEFGEISARLSEFSAEEFFYRLKSRLSYGAFKELVDIVKEL